MATIDPTILRNTQDASIPYFSILQPAILLSAIINDAGIARGERAIIYDNGTENATKFAAIQAGQSLEVDTIDGVKKVRVKSIAGNQVAGTVTVAENAIDWSNGLDIRILHNYEIWTIPPAILEGIFKKDFTIQYVDQNSQPDPVVIMGGHRAGDVSTGPITFDLNASGSYAIAQGATINPTCLWTCINMDGTTTGITIDNPAAFVTTVEITLPAQYWLACAIIDSNNKTQTSRRVIFTDPPYVDFKVQSLSGSWQSGGYRLSLAVTGAVTLADFPDGALALLWYKNYFGAIPGFILESEEGYVNLWGVQDNSIVAGYIRNDNDRDNILQATTEIMFEVTTPESLLDNTTDFGSVSLVATVSPGAWYEYASWLTVGRAVHHELKWHTTVLETCDVYGLVDNVQGLQYADFTESSILQRVNGLAYSRGHFAKLCSDRLGRLHLVTDSQMLNDAGRLTLDTVFGITAVDIQAEVGLVRQPEGTLSAVELDGFYFNGSTISPFISICGGYRESAISYGMPEFRGVVVQSVKSQVASSQVDTNEKSGRVLAAANIPIRELRLTMAGNYIGAFDIIPSAGWYSWNITDSDLQRNLSIQGTKWLCRSVTTTIQDGGIIITEVIIEPEAFGPDGIQGNYPLGYPVPVVPNPPGPQPQPNGGAYYVAAYADPTGTDYVRAVIIRISDGAIGAPVTVDSFEIADGPIITSLSSAKAIVCYQHNYGGDLYGAVLNLSGLVVTPNASLNLVDNIDYLGGVTRLTATRALVMYSKNTPTVALLTVTGVSVSIGAASPLGAAQGYYGDVTALSPEKAIAAWYETSGGAAYWKARIVNISGSTITLGASSYTFDSELAGYPSSLRIVKLTTTKVAVAYELRYDDGGYDKLSTRIVVLDISGDVITPATPIEIFALSLGILNPPYTGYKNLFRYSETSFLVISGLFPVVVGGINYYNLQALMCTVSGSTITAHTPITFLVDRAIETNPCCVLSGNKATILYSDSWIPTKVTATLTSTTVVDNNDDTTFGSQMGHVTIDLVY